MIVMCCGKSPPTLKYVTMHWTIKIGQPIVSDFGTKRVVCFKRRDRGLGWSMNTPYTHSHRHQITVGYKNWRIVSVIKISIINISETSLPCVNRLYLNSWNNQRYNCSKYLRQFSRQTADSQPVESSTLISIRRQSDIGWTTAGNLVSSPVNFLPEQLLRTRDDHSDDSN
ncbi:hypothetical protein J6590_076324 [Homalodisca vitripennis]|nr:hypothetical protein J6590_076324 [Homalodisca vitripennis]